MLSLKQLTRQIPSIDQDTLFKVEKLQKIIASNAEYMERHMKHEG